MFEEFDGFDENDEEKRQRQKLYEFYEVFSMDVRRQLLSKNVPVIQSVYDVLYPRTKETLLSKNLPSEINIDTSAESIRDALLSKIVEENFDLSKFSEDFRKSILSRNEIIKSSAKLNREVDSVRKNLLAKNNNSNSNNIDTTADKKRNDLLSKNKESLNREKEIEKDNISFRENNISKNKPSINELDKNFDGHDLDDKSREFRENNLHKNVPNENNLEKKSEDYRDNNLHKNISKNSVGEDGDMSRFSEQHRNDNLRKNVPNNSDLEEDSEKIREANISKNISPNDLPENDWSLERKNLLNKNVSSETDLLSDSEASRKDDLSKNISSNTDLLSDSEATRADDLSKNVSSETDLLTDSEIARIDDLSKNKPIQTDLLTDSEISREDDLSKNTVAETDLLKLGETPRLDDLSKNKPIQTDLLSDSEVSRVDDLSKNKPIETDLLKLGETPRVDDLSKNKPIETDLLTDSKNPRADDLSKNKPIETDLLTDSEIARIDDLSKNKPIETDLLTDSEIPRIDDLSKNKPIETDLLTDSEIPREDDLSKNTPIETDLLQLGEVPRVDLLSANVPNESDLLELGEIPREDLLSANVPNESNLLELGETPRENLLSANVPNESDLLELGETPRGNLLSSNVPNESDLFELGEVPRENLLSSNVPNESDLLELGEVPRGNLLSANDPINTNVLDLGENIREGMLSSNVPNDSNLLSDSVEYRNSLLSKNPNTDLGVTFEGLGTFSYLGFSKVAAQGLVIRTFLLSKNKANQFLDLESVNINNLDFSVRKNDYILGGKEYDRSTANSLTNQLNARGQNIEGLKSEIDKQFQKNADYSSLYQYNLQARYGFAQSKEAVIDEEITIGGGYFGVNTLSSQGGGFESFGNPGKFVNLRSAFQGNITEALRNYNLSRNLYNLQGIQAVTTMSNYIGVISANNDLGFQDLINKTIGSFNTADSSISAQQYGNLIPRGVLSSNNFLYLRGSAESMLRSGEPTDPSQKDSWIGTPSSMMAKTTAGNPLDEQEFKTGARGVKYIMKNIRNNKDVKMSVNYDPQNTNKYVIGQTGDEPRYSRQRFTIRNPHSPSYAKSLVFKLTNYSSNKDIYLPPYIDSFSDSHTANWNEINFLGRPEPIYTYNNSNRDGSISFMVLTDYSERVLLGRKYNEDGMDKIVKDITTHFTDSKVNFNVRDTDLDFGDLDKKTAENNKAKEEILKQKQVNNASNAVSTLGDTEATDNNPPENAESDNSLLNLNKENLNIEGFKEILNLASNKAFDYNAASNQNKNVYDFMTNNITTDLDGQIITSAGDTLKRLDEMVSNLSFQPSYFSGDKVDFLRRMDFLAKLTKPAVADKCSGFSFTKAPVAHIKLGDWWDHDIVVKSVSVDYSDSPWAIDGVDTGGQLQKRVQPLWAKVTLQFNFIGRFGGEGVPVLSTDNGGVYSRNT